VIEDGQTGFLVNNADEAVRALKRLGEIDRKACRQRVQECFSVETMVAGYEQVYRTIFELEGRDDQAIRSQSDPDQGRYSLCG
jgi:glycosyltransferase involved in cell wall biosynthesis